MTKDPCCVKSEYILGMNVHVTSGQDVTQTVCTWAQQGLSRYVCVATVNNVMESCDCVQVRRVMNEADIVTADGVPLVWALRLLGHKEASRVYGPDLTPAILAMAEREQLPVGFYGGCPGTLLRLRAVVAARFPNLRISYYFSPPFRELTPEEDAEIVGDIRRSGVRILFVGLNSPKQDMWMAAHRGRISAVMLGVGAAFDFLAGTKKQAPRWLMPIGLEWLFRLSTEPRRLWKRYLKHNPRFVILFAAQLLHLRLLGGKPRVQA